MFPQAFQCRIQNFATAKTKGATAKIVREFENVGEGGAGVVMTGLAKTTFRSVFVLNLIFIFFFF